MRKTRYRENQIIKVLKEVEGGCTVKAVCREYCIAEGTYYSWKSTYGGMEASDIKLVDYVQSSHSISLWGACRIMGIRNSVSGGISPIPLETMRLLLAYSKRSRNIPRMVLARYAKSSVAGAIAGIINAFIGSIVG